MGFKSSDWKYLRYKLEDRWHHLGLRRRFEDNPLAVGLFAGGAVLLLVITLAIPLIPREPDRYEVPEQVWFYDLNTGELFQVKRSKLPPVEAPSGPRPDGSPAGVRAYVYPGAEGAAPEVALLEKFSEAGKDRQADYDPRRHDPNTWAAGRYCCRPGDSEWVAADSPEGRGLYRDYYLHPDSRK